MEQDRIVEQQVVQLTRLTDMLKSELEQHKRLLLASQDEVRKLRSLKPLHAGGAWQTPDPHGSSAAPEGAAQEVMSRTGGSSEPAGIGGPEPEQAHQTLRLSDLGIGSLANALAEGVVLHDADGWVLDCNAGAERIFGRSLAQLKGAIALAPDWPMSREDGTPMLPHELPSEVAKATGQAQSNQIVRHKKPDGSVLWTLVNVQPLFDDSGALAWLVTSFGDITERKNAELEIVRLNVELEQRVARRTAQLQNANQELEAFSYSVAHDLRSPLISIEGFCALLQKSIVLMEPSGKASHYLGRIRAGVSRMGELTDGLLLLARLSRASLKWEAVDLSMEASKVMQRLAEMAPERVLSLVVEPGLVATGDAALVRQVLENLLGNAWKFTAKRPVAHIRMGQVKQGNDGQAVYAVQDNGAGFDMAFAHKLFGTFERLHAVQDFPGSGIGLATVNRIISRHGGSVWAESAVDEGTTFYFTLGSPQALTSTSAAQAFGAAAANALDARAPLHARVGLGATFDQFSSAFEHSALGMSLVAPDGRRLRVNSALCKMLGYSQAEMMSRTIDDITYAQDVAWDLGQRTRALAGEMEAYQGEKRYVHKAGHMVWGDLTCSLVRDADRKPLHFITQIQDITARKKVEQTLRESEERFRALTQLSSDWFWEQDEHFRFEQVSGDDSHTVKFGRQNVLGMTRWELDHCAMDDKVWARHQAQLQSHQTFCDFEMTVLDHQGQIRHESISGVPKYDALGRFTGYRGTGRDMTEIRRISAALHASEQQLRDITDTVQALIAYVTADQRIGFHNRAYQEVFGLAPEQIIGKTLLEVMGKDFFEVARPHVEEVLRGYPAVYQCSQLTAHGNRRDFLVSYLPRYGEGQDEGLVIGFYALATDITDFKRTGEDSLVGLNGKGLKGGPSDAQS
ncbi:PAS domain S-box protein [Polaromonas glacialis]|uniref:PAS domain S-box protein n=1 Tax=Polaromonas glacialis TaxID=866564 RepID=UPI000A6BEA86|nr:PAS domain S-box protein [Polaromonas glacialis]